MGRKLCQYASACLHFATILYNQSKENEESYLRISLWTIPYTVPEQICCWTLIVTGSPAFKMLRCYHFLYCYLRCAEKKAIPFLVNEKKNMINRAFPLGLPGTCKQ